ncbi:MAG: hypothetical protein Q8O67_07100 [Deltaproteobacteria bacterium]|nr:hypothetical protein [Deltaproteobacteria bacterium]
MRFNQVMTAATLGLLCATGAAAVPDTFLYVGDLQEDGAPADGNFSVTFQMFNDRVAGTKVFEESVVSLPVIDGVLLHELGTAPSNALDDAELAAGELFLSVVVNGTVLEPRVAIRSVPFAATAAVAIDATNAGTVGGVSVLEIQDGSALGDGFLKTRHVTALQPLFRENVACNTDGNFDTLRSGGTCVNATSVCPAGTRRLCGTLSCVAIDGTTSDCPNTLIGSLVFLAP